MQIKKILALVLFSFVTTVTAQVEKGDEYFAKSEYLRAIHYYQKDARSRTPEKRTTALVKLGNTYKVLNDYAKAVDYYGKAVETGNALPTDAYYNYAQVLKANGRYEEAVTQYEHYMRLSPGDKYAREAMKFCQEIRYYLSKPIEYAVKNTETINTSQAEFSPFVMNNKLVFIAERNSFDFVQYNINNSNGQPYLNMYIANIKGTEPKKTKTLSKRVNSDFHEGPACVSADGHTLYFTRVMPFQKGAVNHAKIFAATGSERSWKNIRALDINSESFSVAHPCISADNNTLFFTSNMPGGYGGKDIWLSQRNGEQWGVPVNLGPDINTTGDEMFPSIKKDGTLYFASNGLPGFGGLDIYSARNVESKWILARNEGLNLNSNSDDFGITFLNDSIGYFSSNRAGGKGGDDIYVFTYTNKSMVLSGTVLLTENSKNYAKFKKVVLLDNKGNPVDSTKTNEKGYFEFKNLLGDKKYMAVVEEEDPTLVGKARFYLAEKDSVIHRVTSKLMGNRFVFRNLPVEAGGLPDLYTEDDLVFAGALMTGPTGAVALKNAKLKLVNDFGDVMEETTTNEFGAFAFRNIPSDQNYLISIEETDVSLPEGTKITLTNKSGKEIKTFYKTKGKFTFKVLQSDKTLLDDMDAEDVNLIMGLYGYMYDQDKRPITSAKITVKEMDGTNPRDYMTTDKGKFNFKNLNAEKEYLFEADENDPNLKGVKRIFIADSKGRIYKVIDLVGGKFSFKLLEADKTALGEFVVDDPWLKVAEMKKKKEIAAKTETVAAAKETPKVEEEEKEETLTIIESINYAYGDHKLGPDGEKVLNKAVEVMKENPRLIMEINSHTDSHSSNTFNMTLSNKRAQTAVDYLVVKGIARTRLKARGYGETRLLNKCADGVTCSEEEHKVNRRTEFKITKPIKK
jgi:outer membrane protein OmpA-like peptidoglycan-associated protein/tetratricopeptide (TPR) repeat protein